jgi:prophage DNA circulation protein
MSDVGTHYGRIRAAIAAAERKRAGGEQYTARFTVSLLPAVSEMVADIAADLKCSRTEVIRYAIEEYAKDFRFGQRR